MKLIDSDAVLNALDDLPMDYGRWDSDGVVDAVNALPAVDAIPVSWLKEKLTRHPELSYAETDGIQYVLDMWEARH